MMRNFMPASLERPLGRKAASAANGSVVNSRAMYMVISSSAATSSIIPVADRSINPKYSPCSRSMRRT